MTNQSLISDLFLILGEHLRQPIRTIEIFDSLSDLEQASIVYRLFEMVLDDSEVLERIRVAMGSLPPSVDPLSSKRETELLLSALAVGFRPNTANHPLGVLWELYPFRFDLTSQSDEGQFASTPNVGTDRSLS